ncbi:hypothetical protein [Methylobacter tundripaludum]|jgi:hypothetical protein|uniref:hypothetical protein n=1 Tax=Methylobacter tundripaludum TaxID=173365 RepID=UPI001377976B|nr:hypothetical protein [Methylobacter tundripaludum]
MNKLFMVIAVIILSACANQPPLSAQERADNEDCRSMEKKEQMVKFIRNQQTYQNL